MISIIVAMADNNAIGKNNQLLWRLPADLQWFKKNTLGKPIIMGRKTYESIGKPLPGRRNIIVTRQTELSIPGCEVTHSLQEALSLASEAPEIMVIGGGEIFKEALPLAKRLYVTQVHTTFDADVFFPAIDLKAWKEVFHEDRPADLKNPHSHSFLIWDRI